MENASLKKINNTNAIYVHKQRWQNLGSREMKSMSCMVSYELLYNLLAFVV